MKRSTANLLCAVFAGAMTLIVPAAFAGPIYKAASGTDLAAGASWTNGVAPGSADVATWLTGSLGGALTMSTAPSWSGIAMTAATADPVIAAPGSGAFTLGSSGIDLSSSANNLTINAPITLGANQIWNINSGKTLTVGGIVSGTSFGITKAGAGTLTLSGNNTYTGGTTISAGTLAVSLNNAALGTGSVTLNGGTLGIATSANNLSIVNNVTIGPNGGTIACTPSNKTLALTGALSGAGNLTIGGGGNNGTINPQFSANTMTSGTITLLGSASGTARVKSTTTSSAVLDWVFNGGGTDVSGTFNWGSFSGTGSYNAYNNNSGTTLYSIGGNNHDATYSGAQGQTGTGQVLSFLKVGTGAQTFSGASSYTGTTTVENGSLIASNNVNATGNGPFGNSSSAIVLGDATSESANQNVALMVGGAFTMARPVTVGAGNATTATFTLGGNTANNSTISGAVTLNQNLVVTQAVGGTVTISGAIGSGSQTLTKVGGGTAILSGANSYTGSTIVSNGVLMVGNTSPANGVVTVEDGAAAGVFATSDATYWSPSTLTVGTTTGGALQFNLGGSITGPNANTLLTPASLTLNGTTTINIGSCPQALGVYPLFNGYSSGTLVLGSQPAGLLGKITVSGATVNYQLTNFVQDVWTAAVNTNWDTVTANWTNTVGGNKYISGYPVVFDDTAAGTSPLLVNITNAVTPNAITVNNTNKAYVIGGLAIGGATGLTKTGNNALTLTGTNTFTGNLAILGGTLAVGSGGGGQLGGGTYAGTIDDETLLLYNSTNAQTLSGVISGPGALLVTNGTLTLNSAQNTFTGGATFTNATVIIGNGDALGTGTINANGGTLEWNYTAGNVNVGNGIAVNGPVTFEVVNGNWTQNGGITGSGTITRGILSLNSLYLNGDNSGFTGSYQDQANGSSVTRILSASSGSANAHWIWNQNTSGRMSLNFGNGTIYWGSMAGSGFVQQANNGTTVVEAGALGLNDIFSGVMQQVSGTTILALTKVGTGTMTLSGANTFLGGVNINNGILCVSNTSALSTAGNITFGGGTLQYSGVNGVDYSSRIANSTAAAISIDLNGTNVTFASALPASNTGGLALTNSTGVGTNKLTLTAASAYTGSTIINGGTLALSGSGTINSSTNITVASGGTFDVSGVSYTLGGSQTLSGSGTVTGAVTTASSGSAILPGGAGTVGTLTFKNIVNLGSGAAPMFDVGTSHSSGNDQIVVAGNLTCGASDTIHVNALNGSTPLDETADYVLFSVAGTTTMTTQPALVFDSTPNSPPSDASHYSIQKSGNNVVLHYSSTANPVVTSVIVTNTADGSAVGVRGQSATVDVTVQPGSGTLGAGSVTANLSLLGGSSSQVLNYLGANEWSYTILLGQGAVVGNDSVGVTATDSLSASGSGVGNFTVNASSLTWDGSGTDANWGTGGNWVGGLPPGFAGDSVTFTGSANTAPNLEANYNVAGVTFDGAASSFTNVSTTGKTLTLSGPVNNSSSNPQFFNLAVNMNGSPTISDDGNGITFAGPISGSGGMEVSGGTVTLAGADTYTANTIIDGGATLKAGNSAALPYGSGKGNISISGTLDINGTNAAINGLSGSGTVDNTSTNMATLTIGNADVGSTFAGAIQNTGTNLALVKIGAGTLTFNGAKTYSGGTTLSNGTLAFGNGSAFGTGPVTLDGGTLSWNYVSGNVTFTNNLVVNGAATFDVVNGNATFNGSLSGSGTLTRSAGVNPPVSFYLGGDNSGFTGTFQDQNSANSVVRFTSTNSGSASARWIFNQPQLGRTSLPTVAGTIRFGSLSGAGILTPNAAVATTVEVGALGLNDTFSGSLSETAGGTIALTKVGAGTLTMSGANSYTGPTIVSNGTLIVSSATVSSGDFTLVDGTTLGVSLVTSNVSLNMTSLTLGNHCTNSFTGINSTTVPAVANSGALTLSGHVVVNVQGTNFTVAHYPLISYSSITGTGGFAVGSLPAGITANIITNGSAIVLNVTQIPVLGPVPITNSVSGNTLTLTWPASQGWKLQMQTNSLTQGLGTNWVYITDGSISSTNITIDPTKPTVFYRLANP